MTLPEVEIRQVIEGILDRWWQRLRARGRLRLAELGQLVDECRKLTDHAAALRANLSQAHYTLARKEQYTDGLRRELLNFSREIQRMQRREKRLRRLVAPKAKRRVTARTKASAASSKPVQRP